MRNRSMYQEVETVRGLVSIRVNRRNCPFEWTAADDDALEAIVQVAQREFDRAWQRELARLRPDLLSEAQKTASGTPTVRYDCPVCDGSGNVRVIA